MVGYKQPQRRVKAVREKKGNELGAELDLMRLVILARDNRLTLVKMPLMENQSRFKCEALRDEYGKPADWLILFTTPTDSGNGWPFAVCSYYPVCDDCRRRMDYETAEPADRPPNQD